MSQVHTPAAKPSEGGYFMPPEWHRHEATWLSWPTNLETWPRGLEAVREAYVSMIRELSCHETVHLLVDDESASAQVRERLREQGISSGVVFHILPTVDAWIRDYGPNFLVRSGTHAGVALNNWHFNAWGGKYEDLAEDNRVPPLVGQMLGVPCFEPGIVLEGGSIDVNGGRLCMTTRQCLLNPNRNPGLSQSELEVYLSAFLGIQEVIWLEQGISGDDTDGHIDDIARFTDPETVVCCVEPDPTDENFNVLDENFRCLTGLSTERQLFRVEPLPMPDPVFGEGFRLPASYANFYVANGLVLVPVFGQKKDRLAIAKIQALFPERRVVGIPAAEMVSGLGAVHCLTQQQPSI